MVQPMENIQTYLGDGVYATYDGHYILLDLRGQQMPHQELVLIALEPEVLDSLDRFRKTIKDLSLKGVNDEQRS